MSSDSDDFKQYSQVVSNIQRCIGDWFQWSTSVKCYLEHKPGNEHALKLMDRGNELEEKRLEVLQSIDKCVMKEHLQKVQNYLQFCCIPQLLLPSQLDEALIARLTIDFNHAWEAWQNLYPFDDITKAKLKS